MPPVCEQCVNLCVNSVWTVCEQCVNSVWTVCGTAADNYNTMGAILTNNVYIVNMLMFNKIMNSDTSSVQLYSMRLDCENVAIFW